MPNQKAAPTSRPSRRNPTQRKQKQFVPKPAASPKEFVPAFLYRSACHGALGVKKPCTVEKKDGKSIGEGHLGVFRCSECKKHSTFSRSRNTEGTSIKL